MTPDLSALAAYAGTHEKKLFSTLFNKFDAITDLTFYQGIKVATQMTKLRAGKGARPGSSTFQSSGKDLVYTGTVLEPKWGKRDISVVPSEYFNTWMAELRSTGVNPKELPFAKYVWDQVAIELAAELNDRTVFFGFDKADAVAYSALTAYDEGDYITFDTPSTGQKDFYKCIVDTTAGDSPVTDPEKWEMCNAEAICIGLKKRVIDAIAAGKLTPIATGAITNTTAYAQFTEMYRSHSPAVQKEGLSIFASFDSTYALADDFENKVSKYTEIDSKTGEVFLSKTNKKCKIVPATWMGDSGMLMASPKRNIIIGTDAASDFNKISTDEHLRSIDAGFDFSLGTIFRDFDELRVNDQQ